MLQLARPGDVLSAVGRAHSIVASAYLLAPGPLLRALEEAAERGARVIVRLEAKPHDDSRGALAKLNRRTVRELRRAGADARVHELTHLKAVLCDGTVYLDDRNFAAHGDQIVLRDRSRCAARAVADAVGGRHHPALRNFWTSKAEALAAEGRMLDGAATARAVDVETESFSWNGPVYGKLKRLAQRGVRCRLIVDARMLRGNPKEARALARLQDAGVQVRAGNCDAKAAIVDAKTAWTGSSHCTSPYCDGVQSEWAVRTRLRAVVGALQSRFDAHWQSAKVPRTALG